MIRRTAIEGRQGLSLYAVTGGGLRRSRERAAEPAADAEPCRQTTEGLPERRNGAVTDGRVRALGDRTTVVRVPTRAIDRDE